MRGKPRETAAVILAAGYSSRMGAFKPLLPLEGVPAAEGLIRRFRQAGIEKIIVVTGHLRERMTGLLAENGAEEAYNAGYGEGMLSSVKTGIRAAEGRDVLLTLTDCPLLSPRTVKLLLDGTGDEKRESGPAGEEGALTGPQSWEPEPETEQNGNPAGRKLPFIRIPCYRGKKGHPVYLPGVYGPLLLDYEGEGGLKGFLHEHRDRILYVETGDESVVLDMDTEEEYRELCGYAENREREKSEGKERPEEADRRLRRLLADRRLFLVRHGQPRQHSGKIFLGQCDVPLSPQGLEEAAAAAERLAAAAPAAAEIYTSDLVRARQTAEIIARHPTFTDLPLKENARFREISLGSWDGRLMDEIREEFPRAYRERGSDRLRFKSDPFAENFYDVQYRVVKELTRILEEKKAKGLAGDLILVTHAGVISILRSNLEGIPLDEALAVRERTGSVTVLNGEGRTGFRKTDRQAD